MALTFEWDDRKAETNQRKHGVSFEEAATAFGDRLSVTILDPDHAGDEDRYALLGLSHRNRLLVVITSNEAIISVSSAHDLRRGERGRTMKKAEGKRSTRSPRELASLPEVGGTKEDQAARERLAHAKEEAKKAQGRRRTDEMRPEYDFSGGVRGKYAERFAEGTNVVVLEPDLARLFGTSDAVNRALRGLAELARRQLVPGRK